MLTVYGLKHCDTCKKAVAWLDDAGIVFSFHDVRTDGLDRDTVMRWLAAFGPEALINRRGTTWRSLPEAEKAREPVDLILAYHAVFKRPVFSWSDQLRLGFTDAVKQDLSALR